jgi:glycosyltransferase involved in cell wall biosynthesis
MELSVVVPTLNGRDQLGGCLDALVEHVPEAEVIVVNGPSADGTTGMVSERGDVDTLVEIADRNVNAARNAGFEAATDEYVALLRFDRVVDEGWLPAVESGLEGGSDVLTGPTRTTLEAPEAPARSIAGRSVTFCNGENVVFSRSAIEALDGFDEYLEVGGSRDASHRLAGLDFDVEWVPEMSVHSQFGADGGEPSSDRRTRYRSLAYQHVKNYGIRPTVLLRTLGAAGADAVDAARSVLDGEGRFTSWFGHGRAAIAGLGVGAKDGWRARRRDRSRRRNPNGISARADRVVQRYDWR